MPHALCHACHMQCVMLCSELGNRFVLRISRDKISVQSHESSPDIPPPPISRPTLQPPPRAPLPKGISTGKSMHRVFLVAEKPSIAKAVAQHLSGNQVTSRNTGLKYIKNYDFTFRFPASLGGECHATMSSVIGHTVGHDFEPGLRKWGSCRPEVLFDSITVKFVDEVLNIS